VEKPEFTSYLWTVGGQHHRRDPDATEHLFEVSGLAYGVSGLDTPSPGGSGYSATEAVEAVWARAAQPATPNARARVTNASTG
jgi:hypothetical protein